MNLESNSTVVDIDSLTSPADGSEEASSSSGHMVSAVQNREIIIEINTTHHNESSSSTSTDHHDEKKKVIFGEYSSTNHNSSSSSINRGGATPRHAMTYNSSQSNSPRDQICQNHNPNSNLDEFMKFLQEHKLSKNLTQVAIAVVACLYGTLGRVKVVGYKLGATFSNIRSNSSPASTSPMAAEQLGESAENGVQNGKILAANNDEFDGVIVEMIKAMDPLVFHSMLKASLSQWRQQKKKGVWIKLPIQLANLVEFAVKEGFWFHHAEPTYIMLVYWIPKSQNTIPANATHRVRVGAFVMNEKREVLVVQEKTGHLRCLGWKFPTGVVDEGEDISDAATREVKEETGIDSEFVEILAFRQTHKSFFEKSDLFFVCILRPLSFDIQAQELEIEAAAWMPLEEYAAQPFVQNYEIMKRITDIYKAKVDGVYAGFSRLLTESGFPNQAKSYLYFNETGLKRSCNNNII